MTNNVSDTNKRWYFRIDEAVKLHPDDLRSPPLAEASFLESAADTVVLRNFDLLSQCWVDQGAQVLFTNLSYWETIDHGAVLGDGRLLLVEVKKGKPGKADLEKLRDDLDKWDSWTPASKEVKDAVSHTHEPKETGRSVLKTPERDGFDFNARRQMAAFLQRKTAGSYNSSILSDAYGLPGFTQTKFEERHLRGMDWRRIGATASELLSNFPQEESFAGKIKAVLLASGVNQKWLDDRNASTKGTFPVTLINYAWTAPPNGYPTGIMMETVGELLV